MAGAIEPNKVYTLEEAREIFEVADSTFRLLIRRGEINGRKVGRQWRFLGSDLLRVFEETDMSDLSG